MDRGLALTVQKTGMGCGRRGLQEGQGVAVPSGWLYFSQRLFEKVRRRERKGRKSFWVNHLRASIRVVTTILELSSSVAMDFQPLQSNSPPAHSTLHCLVRMPLSGRKHKEDGFGQLALGTPVKGYFTLSSPYPSLSWSPPLSIPVPRHLVSPSLHILPLHSLQLSLSVTHYLQVLLSSG